MAKIPVDYMERVYAGWLGKMVGIRLGAAVEGWEYARIRELFGELDHYPAWYKRFAADDDSNGPLYFLRALEDKRGPVMQAQDVGEALLNYAPYEHGFFWWGGYGVSTEHTAYLNLRRGIQAPDSGSVETNGAAIAEQIGGQIFIDTWGLVSPGNLDQAAELAAKAASATHGGNGVYGGVFVACCIAAAFVERDIRRVIEMALARIPADCEYTRVARAVLRFHDSHPDAGWRDCFHFLHDHFGYDRYPGVCHIIPNAGVMVLAMAYGNGSFEDTLNICNMCGWDTDCNVGNVGAIMGVLCGLDAMDTQKWLRPINDLCIRSGVLGDMNIVDIPYGACYIARLAYALAGEEIPEGWRDILQNRIHDCHFEFPKSTHALEVRTAGRDNTWHFVNTDESAYTGKRCLKFFATRLEPGQELFVHRKNYYWKEDFSDSRYDPCFSPIFYPGQSFSIAVGVPEYGDDIWVYPYARDTRMDKTFRGEKVLLKKGEWIQLTLNVPGYEGGLVDETGVCLTAPESKRVKGYQLVAYLDDLHVFGQPDYSVLLRNERYEVWTERHQDMTQFARMRGKAEKVEDGMRVSCEEEGEWYTGFHSWRDYDASFTLTPEAGGSHLALVRVQGAMRSYAAGFVDGQMVIQKNDHGYTTLAQAPCAIVSGEKLTLAVSVRGARITARCAGTTITCEDPDRPYLEGEVGVRVADHSSAVLERIAVKGV